MNRKTFFKILAGVIVAPSLFANFKEKFLYKDIVEAKKFLPKAEKNNYFGWTIKDGENCRDIAQQIDIDYKL